MPLSVTWLGHACWSLKTGKTTLLIDPFLDDSPVAPIKASAATADFILITHGHFDHIADAAKIAKRTRATCVANFEICEWLAAQGIADTCGMNVGGAVQLPFGRVKLTVAHHSSTLPDGKPGGNPGGFRLDLPDGKVYFAGDTALFSDMKLYATGGLDIAILPIGDLFTMGPDDSLEAIKLLQPRHVLPSHYNTWPPIAQDAARWAERVRQETSALPVVLQPGGTFTL